MSNLTWFVGIREEKPAMKNEVVDKNLGLLENMIFNDIGAIPCNTSQRAKKFVAVACRCLRGMPVAAGLTPFSLIENRAVLVSGVNLVETWLAGEPISHEQFDGAFSEAFETGRTTRSFDRNVTGEPAAFWAAVFLLEAAWKATGPLGWTNEAAAKANLSLHCSYRTNRSREAVEFIQALFGSYIGFGIVHAD